MKLPALRLDDAASPTNAPIVIPATNAPPAASVEPFGPPAPVADATAAGAIGATNSPAPTVSAPLPVVLDGTERITPQMLVDFFRPVLNGTNAAAAAATAPAGSFTPPQMQPSSSATYKSN